ncbi:MAG: hypothetical protein MK033_10915 [Candidatus Caenarcaniphilales bacterium]|nr:hypothetical protein [Candidatus Caenarcaniphilales bacterium]
MSYYSPKGEPSGELWQEELEGEYFFSNNTESEIYNHTGTKYGFFLDRMTKKILYLSREGLLENYDLELWRKSIQTKSSMYFLGLQDITNLSGSFSRRSLFIFASNGELILHYRTTDITALMIKDYVKMNLAKFLSDKNETIDSIKILAADGDFNAQTYIPNEKFSDEKLNSYGFHLILESQNTNSFINEAKSSNAFSTLNKLKKKLKLLNPIAIISGFMRYFHSIPDLWERITSNLSLLSLDLNLMNEQRVFELNIAEKEFLISDESLIKLKDESCIILRGEKLERVYVSNIDFELREIKDFSKTYNLKINSSDSSESKKLFLKSNSSLSLIQYDEMKHSSNIVKLELTQNAKAKFTDTSSSKKIILDFKQSNFSDDKNILTDLAKSLFGFDSNNKVTSFYGERVHPITGELSFHHGIDFNAYDKQIIFAPLNCKTIEEGFNDKYGYFLVVEAINIYNEESAKLNILLVM